MSSLLIFMPMVLELIGPNITPRLVVVWSGKPALVAMQLTHPGGRNEVDSRTAGQQGDSLGRATVIG